MAQVVTSYENHIKENLHDFLKRRLEELNSGLTILDGQRWYIIVKKPWYKFLAMDVVAEITYRSQIEFEETDRRYLELIRGLCVDYAHHYGIDISIIIHRRGVDYHPECE